MLDSFIRGCAQYRVWRLTEREEEREKEREGDLLCSRKFVGSQDSAGPIVHGCNTLPCDHVFQFCISVILKIVVNYSRVISKLINLPRPRRDCALLSIKRGTSGFTWAGTYRVTNRLPLASCCVARGAPRIDLRPHSPRTLVSSRRQTTFIEGCAGWAFSRIKTAIRGLFTCVNYAISVWQWCRKRAYSVQWRALNWNRAGNKMEQLLRFTFPCWLFLTCDNARDSDALFLITMINHYY